MRNCVPIAALLLVSAAHASSHRDSPFISEDPAADNTDVYAFVSTEPGRGDFVTILANFVPLQEPANGPNFYRTSDFVTYDIKIDTDGDAKEDLTYRFEFKTRYVDPGSQLYNLGVIGPPPDPADPSSPYTQLNQVQTYTLRELGAGGPKVLLSNARTAPWRPGPKSLLPNPGRFGPPIRGDTTLTYQALAELAVHTVPQAGGLRAFVGPRDEGFFVNLGTAFDLVNPSPVGADGTSGYNVTTLAVEVPKSRFIAAGDTDGIIGIWATASRVRLPVCNTANGQGGPGQQNQACDLAIINTHGVGTQVSRLANPLFNEFLDPLRAKDFYNASAPHQDEKNLLQYILNPGTSQGPNAWVSRLKELVPCTDVTQREDQVASFMLGYPPGVVNGFPGNRETQSSRPAIADELRLNYNIPPSPVPNPLGVVGGDFAGFPNGRRVTDDATDILLKLWGGVFQANFGGTACPAAAALTDNVSANDVPFLPVFPYLGLPHEGFSHTHGHDQP